MATYVNPSNSFRPLSEEMGRLFRYSGRQSFIADTSTTLVSDVDSVGVTDGPLGAFVKVSDSGLDFTVDTGEAMVEGALVATDEQNTVTLPDNDTVTIYLAIDPSVEGSIIVDHDKSGNVSGQPRTPLYEVETASSSVSGETNLREIGEFLNVRNDRYETDDNTGVEVDNANDASLLGGSGPSFYASVGQNESITGAWTFENDVDVSGSNVDISDGRLDIHADFGHLSLYENDTGEQWNAAVSSQNLNLVNQSGGNGLLQIMPGGDVEVPNGDLTANNVVAGNVLDSGRGTAAVSGSERYIYVSGSSPSDSEGQDGDIWIEH